MVASTATYPHEVVRSHMHVAGSGPFKGFLKTCKQVGGSRAGRPRASSDPPTHSPLLTSAPRGASRQPSRRAHGLAPAEVS